MKLWKLLMVVAVLVAIGFAIKNGRRGPDVAMTLEANGILVVNIDNPTWLPKTVTAEMAGKGSKIGYNDLLDIKTVRVQPFGSTIVVLNARLSPDLLKDADLKFHVWEHK